MGEAGRVTCNMLPPRVGENSQACIAVQSNSLNAEGPIGDRVGIENHAECKYTHNRPVQKVMAEDLMTW